MSTIPTLNDCFLLRVVGYICEYDVLQFPRSCTVAMIESKRVPNLEQYVATYVSVTCKALTSKTRK